MNKAAHHSRRSPSLAVSATNWPVKRQKQMTGPSNIKTKVKDRPFLPPPARSSPPSIVLETGSCCCSSYPKVTAVFRQLDALASPNARDIFNVTKRFFFTFYFQKCPAERFVLVFHDLVQHSSQPPRLPRRRIKRKIGNQYVVCCSPVYIYIYRQRNK